MGRSSRIRLYNIDLKNLLKKIVTNVAFSITSIIFAAHNNCDKV